MTRINDWLIFKWAHLIIAFIAACVFHIEIPHWEYRSWQYISLKHLSQHYSFKYRYKLSCQDTLEKKNLRMELLIYLDLLSRCRLFSQSREDG